MTVGKVVIQPELLGRLQKATRLHNYTVDEAVAVAVEAWVEAHCPIPGCTKVLQARGGWDSHVATPKNHRNWHPDVKDGKERKRLFNQENPGWTTGSPARGRVG